MDGLTTEYAGQHIPLLKLLKTKGTLSDLQGPVRWGNPPMLISIDQRKPIMAAENRAPR